MRKESEFKNRDRFIELGITIAYSRKLRGMTQEQLAERVGISRSHLSLIEAPNHVQAFSLDILYSISDALNISPSDLLNATCALPKLVK